MKIGELAQHTGLAPSRIRFYERIGLLRTVGREANGYRSYSSDTVLVLNLITTAQKAGFSLDELRTLLPSDLSQWEHGSLIDTLQRKVRDIETLETQLAHSKAHLIALMKQIEAKPQDMDCAANAKRVLSEMGLNTVAKQAATTGDARSRPAVGPAKRIEDLGQPWQFRNNLSPCTVKGLGATFPPAYSFATKTKREG